MPQIRTAVVPYLMFKLPPFDYFIFLYTHNWVVFWNIVMELFSKAGVSHMRIVAPLYFLNYIPLII